MNRRVRRASLFNQRHRSADRCTITNLRHMVIGRGNHTLCQAVQITHELRKYGARRVERHGHGQLLDVINTRRALNIADLRNVDLRVLPDDPPALQLEHGRGVVDMGGVQQST